jgi:putative transposase
MLTIPMRTPGQRFDLNYSTNCSKTTPSPKTWWVKADCSNSLQSSLVERCLDTEMQVHLDDPKYQTEGKAKRNRRNGHSQKTIKDEFGSTAIEIPRDRNSEFEPVIIKKGQTRFDGFDGKILSFYGRGMTTRDIQAQLEDMYGVEVSATLMSEVTDAVIDEVKTWQSRSLSAVYPLV